MRRSPPRPPESTGSCCRAPAPAVTARRGIRNDRSWIAQPNNSSPTSTRPPLIAAGGIDGPDPAAALIAAGAQAVAVGTLLLRAEEAGTVQTHRDALATRRGAVMTCAFTGRPARALRNG